MEILQHVCLLHQARLLPVAPAPAPAQEPPFPPAPGTPLMLDSPGEVHMMVDLPDTPKIVVVSSEDEGHLEED